MKILPDALAEDDPTHIARFEREARAAAALHHPAVVKVYDTGVDDGIHFIVMEFVEGRGLDEVLRDGTPLDPVEASRIAARVAEALAAAHAAGIVHRDIKPANVMLGPGGVVKVLDFGIARARADTTLTQTAFPIGTAAYMPPERVTGRSGDERSDIYALGCLLYALLTGRPPFVADNTAALLNQQVHDPPRPPHELAAGITPGLEGLVVRMLAKDPADRPQRASEVAARLGDRGSRSTAATIPAGSPAGWSVSGRAMAIGGLAALALALVLIVAGSGGSGPQTGGRHRVSSRQVAHPRLTTSATTSTIVPPPTQPQVSQPPSTPAAAPPTPPQPAHVSPGHGGIPPGQAKGPGPKPKPPKPPKPPKHDGPPPHGHDGQGGDGGD